MRRLRQLFPDELVVIGVHSAKFPTEQLDENIRHAVKRLGIEHPVVNDAGFKIWDSYTVRAWPTLVIIDPRGRIAGDLSGEILADDLAPQIQEIIDQNVDLLNRNPFVLVEPSLPSAANLLRYPSKLLVAKDRLFIADSGNHRIVEVSLEPGGLRGEVVQVFGTGEAGLVDGPVKNAAFHDPHGMAISADQQILFVADTGNHAIRKIDLSGGQVSTIAGTGEKAHGRRTMGKPLETALRSPWGLALLDRYLFIAMAGSHQIWVIIDEQEIGPFAGSGAEALVDGLPAACAFNQPSDLSLGMGYLFVADPEASAVRAIKLTETFETVTIIGQGLFDFGDVDGPVGKALLQHPTGVALGDQVIYLSDTYNHKIKAIYPLQGRVITLIGDGKPGSQDGFFTLARLHEPEGLAVVGDLLYIADTNNHLVRVADLRGQTVDTFVLSGLDRLVIQPIHRPPQVVDPIRVVNLDQVILIEFQLPAGYHFITEAPQNIQINERSIDFVNGKVSYSLAKSDSASIRFTYWLYFCEDQADSRCLFQSADLDIPVVIDSTATIPCVYTINIRI